MHWVSSPRVTRRIYCWRLMMGCSIVLGIASVLLCWLPMPVCLVLWVCLVLRVCLVLLLVLVAICWVCSSLVRVLWLSEVVLRMLLIVPGCSSTLLLVSRVWLVMVRGVVSTCMVNVFH